MKKLMEWLRSMTHRVIATLVLLTILIVVAQS